MPGTMLRGYPGFSVDPSSKLLKRSAFPGAPSPRVSRQSQDLWLTYNPARLKSVPRQEGVELGRLKPLWWEAKSSKPPNKRCYKNPLIHNVHCFSTHSNTSSAACVSETVKTSGADTVSVFFCGFAFASSLK